MTIPIECLKPIKSELSQLNQLHGESDNSNTIVVFINPRDNKQYDSIFKNIRGLRNRRGKKNKIL